LAENGVDRIRRILPFSGVRGSSDGIPRLVVSLQVVPSLDLELVLVPLLISSFLHNPALEKVERSKRNKRRKEPHAILLTVTVESKKLMKDLKGS
jgi:hypothetical protein